MKKITKETPLLINIINGIIIILLFVGVLILHTRISQFEVLTTDLHNSYIEIDSDRQDDYELFIIPNSVVLFDLTDDDLEFYWINTNDVDRYVVKLYEANFVITVADYGMTISIYNQNGFYYILVEKGK